MLLTRRYIVEDPSCLFPSVALYLANRTSLPLVLGFYRDYKSLHSYQSPVQSEEIRTRLLVLCQISPALFICKKEHYKLERDKTVGVKCAANLVLVADVHCKASKQPTFVVPKIFMCRRPTESAQTSFPVFNNK